MKIPVTPSGIETWTFRLIAQSPTALMNAWAGTYNIHKTHNNLALERVKITYHIEVLRFAWGMILKQTLKKLKRKM